ncbi:MAG TPA: alcohol dehydrogenase catalytic domain-containing protein [Acidimicrobiales bacterium]|nr:alcohol dehydrogenase catalytic domain-containing protein [Acidimicrobiales bacterium]
MTSSPSTMLAAVYQGQRTVTVEQLPVPAAAAGQVVIEVSHCGICGSDLHFMMEDWSRPGAVHGHEYSGEIVATGDGVDDWAVGDRVVGGPGHGCGACDPCLAGRTHLCLSREKAGITHHQGAFAAYKSIDAGSLFRIPDRLDLRSAALTEPVAVALRGVRRAGVVAGQRVLVTGAGPIGMLSVAVLRALGVTDITVSEPGERRRHLALAVGASSVVLPDELETPPLPMDLVDAPFHVALECSGRPDAMEAALGQLGRSGTLVLSGTGIIRPKFDTNRIILNELVVTGTCEYTRQDFDDALTLLADGSLPLDLLIESEDVPLGRMQQAMEQLVSGELAGKVMVVPRA